MSKKGNDKASGEEEGPAGKTTHNQALSKGQKGRRGWTATAETESREAATRPTPVGCHRRGGGGQNPQGTMKQGGGRAGGANQVGT